MLRGGDRGFPVDRQRSVFGESSKSCLTTMISLIIFLNTSLFATFLPEIITIFAVGNISYDVSEEQLRDVFSKVGMFAMQMFTQFLF